MMNLLKPWRTPWMLKTVMRKFLLLVVMPVAFVAFWFSLIFAGRTTVDQVWSLIEQLKNDIGR